MDDVVFEQGVQASAVLTQDLERALVVFLAPLLVWLDVRLDKRLVRTLVTGVMALLGAAGMAQSCAWAPLE